MPLRFTLVFETVEGRTALVRPGPCAVGYQLHQLAFELMKLFQLSPDIIEFMLRKLAGVFAGPSTFYRQQSGDLVQAEPHGLRSPDELEARPIRLPVSANTAERPGGLRKQASALVVAHGLDVDSSGHCQSANRERVGHA